MLLAIIAAASPTAFAVSESRRSDSELGPPSLLPLIRLISGEMRF